MPWELLIPFLLKFLESLVNKNDAAARAGFDGPLTAYFKARNPALTWDQDANAYEAHCLAYARCCAMEREKAA